MSFAVETFADNLQSCNVGHVTDAKTQVHVANFTRGFTVSMLIDLLVINRQTCSKISVQTDCEWERTSSPKGHAKRKTKTLLTCRWAEGTVTCPHFVSASQAILQYETPPSNKVSSSFPEHVLQHKIER